MGITHVIRVMTCQQPAPQITCTRPGVALPAFPCADDLGADKPPLKGTAPLGYGYEEMATFPSPGHYWCARLVHGDQEIFSLEELIEILLETSAVPPGFQP